MGLSFDLMLGLIIGIFIGLLIGNKPFRDGVMRFIGSSKVKQLAKSPKPKRSIEDRLDAIEKLLKEKHND